MNGEAEQQAEQFDPSQLRNERGSKCGNPELMHCGIVLSNVLKVNDMNKSMKPLHMRSQVTKCSGLSPMVCDDATAQRMFINE
ncbi:hypothetical protein CHS0354_026428 [Potamilus streckersoni]|uniref:Uncharacterized protein n=1 Tax=Potamilus streckersoni TaxID=2493646 RepID=A0AAE0RPW6_9BIVA|nr:hypothetical protein CHS0354_026428 [Potamilus streckersoni]